MAKPTLLFTVTANELSLIKTKRPYYLAKLKVPAEEGQRIIFQTAPIAATEGAPAVEAEEAEFVITNVHQLEGINDKWWVLSVPALDVSPVLVPTIDRQAPTHSIKLDEALVQHDKSFTADEGGHQYDNANLIN